MKLILNILILFILNNYLFGQKTFVTELEYNFLTDDLAYEQSYEDDLFKRTTLIKQDLSKFSIENNTFLSIIFNKSIVGQFNIFENPNGKLLTIDDIKRKLVRDTLFSCWTGESVEINYYSEIKSFKLAQEWSIDPIKGLLRNRVIGLTPVIHNGEMKKDLFYIGFNNDFSNIHGLNNPSFAYIEERVETRILDKETIEDLIQLIQTKKLRAIQVDEYRKETIITNPIEYLIENFKTDEKKSIENLKGIRTAQYLYIDFDKNLINSYLNSFGLFYPLFDDENKFTYYYCPLIFKP